MTRKVGEEYEETSDNLSPYRHSYNAFVGGTSEHHILNIDQDANLRGLLVRNSDTSQGYTIGMELSSELSRLIFRTVTGG
jgi:hypothetical protein